MPTRLVIRTAGALASACIALAVATASVTFARADGQALLSPLPIETALALREHGGRSPLDLSPDGEWIAQTVMAGDEEVPRATHHFAATGFPFGEGAARPRVILTNTKTGEAIPLGAASSLSWSAVWSPDGQRLAYYSDQGGEAGLWIWDRTTRRAARFTGVIARPFFGFDIVRWSADGQRLLCKILPAGMTVEQANARDSAADPAARFAKAAPGQPSVFVLRAPVVRQTEGAADYAFADLAVLDLHTRQITRLVERATIQSFAFAPDNHAIAFVLHKGWETNSQQASSDLIVQDLRDGTRRVAAAGLRLNYGIEWSWSPDSQWLAYIESGQLGKGRLALVRAADGTAQRVDTANVPSFDPGNGSRPPLWDARGEHVYAYGGGRLWQTDIRSGHTSVAATIPGWDIEGLVSRPELATIFSSDEGRTMWAIARERDGRRMGLYAIDLATGQTRAVLQEEKSYGTVFKLDASATTGEIAFVSADQQHRADVWLFNIASQRARQVSHLNPALDDYALGPSVFIDWRSTDGEPLRGALLLPPDYAPGRRLPLVVWVYGGVFGSKSINDFGFWGDLATFNMHVLATRGYAVLFPDAPVRVGTPLSDLAKTVLPGVNAAIDRGYADPDRLAVMGQSYGSYCTLALIAQTTRFKAAVITAADLHPDLLADYLRMRADGLAATGYYEHGQGRIGGTPWEHRDRYLANSTLFLFDRITTPVLIGQGEKDGPLVASDAIFVGLQRLGKSVEYRIYENEEHVITQRPNVIDFWNRRLDFLAEHLDLTLDDRGVVVFEGDRPMSRKGRH
jgi:dipeptidyl aminopeptidase/acylaminoacyl peptidase